jgi:hypothetical protein
MSTTISGNLKDLTGVAVTSASFVRFWLRGASGNQPRVNGTALIPPAGCGSWFQDFEPNASGVISGTIYSTRDAAGTGNGDIETGGVNTAVWYGMQVFINGNPGPEVPVHAKSGATLDVTTVTPITSTPVSTAPSGDTSYIRLDGGNSPATGLVEFLAGIKTKKIGNIRFAAEFTGSDLAAKINAADADLGSDAGEIWVTQEAGLSATSTISISAKHTLKFVQGGTYSSSASPFISLAGTGASIIGSGCPAQTVLSTSSGTADIIQVNGNVCYAANLTLRSSVVRTGGAGIRVLSGNGGFYAENLEINPVYNGIQITTAGQGGSFKNVLMRDGTSVSGNWNCGITMGGQPSGSTVADCFFDQVQISSGAHAFATAACLIDGGTDTIKFSQCDFLCSSGSSDSIALKLQQTSGLDVPRWIRFIDCSFEGGTTKVAVEATAFKDLRFSNCYIATSLTGLHINASGTGTGLTFDNGVITSCQQYGVKLDTIGNYVYITNNRIGDCSLATNGGYDSILIAAGVQDFYIRGNSFVDLFTETNHVNYNINITAGGSDTFEVTGNRSSGTTISSFLNNGASGTSRSIWANLPTSVLSDVRNTVSFNAPQTFNSAVSVNNSLSTTGTVATSAAQGYAINSANAAQLFLGQNSELITLSTSGATTDSAANLLPANAIILGVEARITTAITTATDWKVGDATQAARFSSVNATLAAGTTSVGLNHHDPTVASANLGPVQAAAAKVRITTTGTPNAGAIRVTVHYLQFVPPTS